MPIFDQQTSILSKLAYYMSQKSQWDAPFSNYHEKMTALMSVFCQKNVNSLKKHCSHAHILSKNILSKTRRSHIFFFSKIRDLLSCPCFVKKPLFSKVTRRYHVFSLEFFIKNRNTVMPKSGQKNVNSVKTILSYGPKKSK